MTTDQAVTALTVALAVLCVGALSLAYYLGGPFALAAAVVFLAIIL